MNQNALLGRALLALIAEFAVFAAVLFVSAGTLLWLAGWSFMALFFGFALAMVLYPTREEPTERVTWFRADDRGGAGYGLSRTGALIRLVLEDAERNRTNGGSRMRLPKKAHTSRPWRIHEIATDFELEDVWALPTPGGSDDFPRLVRQIAASDPSRSFPGAARALWDLRDKLGELLGWDSSDADIGPGVPTLRDRLPADLRDGPSGPEFDALPATSFYLTDDEFAAEGANRTTHGIMHLGWVPDGTGGYRGQMAVLVKPNGLFGKAYMAAIKPFRYLIVYPALMRMIGREWRASTRAPTPAST